MSAMLAKIAINYSAVHWHSSLSRSKIMWKYAAHGSSLTESYTPANVFRPSFSRISPGGALRWDIPGLQGIQPLQAGCVWEMSLYLDLGSRCSTLSQVLPLYGIVHLLLGIGHPGLFHHCLEFWYMCDLYRRFASWYQRPETSDQAMYVPGDYIFQRFLTL